MSDEIYTRIHYRDTAVPTIAALPGMTDRTIIIDGFSKTYAMTGWRLGYAIMPAPLVQRLELLLVHAVGCTAHFTQFAGIQALTGSQEEVDRIVATYRKRRDLLVDGLNELPGVSCQRPEGAFYVFPNITKTGVPSRELAARLLDEAGVAALSGTDFGDYGEGYLRLSYANSLENLERALERMRSFLS
jgi:aspartate/methionine/tyrosine aminotransferase